MPAEEVAATINCDGDLMTLAAYYDSECLEIEPEMSNMVEALQDDMQQYYTGNCEYLGDEKALSLIATCDANGFYRKYYSGDSGCTEESLLQASDMTFGVCADFGEDDPTGLYYMATTT